MDLNGGILALAALGIAVANWIAYWPKIRALRVPLWPTGHQAVAIASVLLALWALQLGTGWLGALGCGTSFLVSGAFLFLTLNSRVPQRRPAVAIGEPALDFVLPDSEGHELRLSDLRGRAVLLKFFRGHW